LLGPDDVPGTSDDYVDLIYQFLGEFAYSYVFDGQLGYLDHALASLSLLDRITGVTIWHVNADEPDLIDYDMTYKEPAQDALFASDPYRSSDHDPVIVGLELGLLNAGFTSSTPIRLGEMAVFTNTTTGPEIIHFEWNFGDGATSNDAQPRHLYEAAGQYTVTLTAANPFEIKVVKSIFEVLTPPHLLVTKTVSTPAPLVSPGDVITYTITAANQGQASAASINLEDKLPSLLLAGGLINPPPGLLYENGTISWSGTMPGQFEFTFSYTATLVINNGIYGIDVVNEVTLSGPDGSAHSTAAFTVAGPPKLSIFKYGNAVDRVLNPGDPIIYTIEVVNEGSSHAFNVRIMDILPEAVIGKNLDILVTVRANDMYTITIPAVVADNATPGEKVINEVTFEYNLIEGSASTFFTVASLTPPPPEEWFRNFLPLLRRY
jgi:uncharacterized repeat protein (TIGR01451 family)